MCEMDAYGSGMPGQLTTGDIVDWIVDNMSEGITGFDVDSGDQFLIGWISTFWDGWTESCLTTLTDVYNTIADDCGTQNVYTTSSGGTGARGVEGGDRDDPFDPDFSSECGLSIQQIIARTFMWWIANQHSELNPPPSNVINTLGWTNFFAVKFSDLDDPCGTEEILGCTNPTACNYNDEATADDGSCDFNSCGGCTDEEACNYDSEATFDNGTCNYTECAGCTDPSACNYDDEATIDDDSCQSIDACGICGGDNSTCGGCTDANACNYDPGALVNDGSCDFASCVGCMDTCATNFDASASIPNESLCTYGQGCTDPEANNWLGFNPSISESCYDSYTDDGSCTYTILGCMDELACNYDPDANVDDGSCQTESCAGCMDQAACNYNASATISVPEECDFDSCYDCKEVSACNYNPKATYNDPSKCEYDSCVGCSDPTACNYGGPEITQDDGNCIYPKDCVNITLENNNISNICPVSSAQTFGENFELLFVPGEVEQYTHIYSGAGFTAGYSEGGADLHTIEDCYGGCTDPEACNYDPEATFPLQGACNEVDECGVCGGDGIPPGACDCDGNVLDCAGSCGGNSVIDACGICGGPAQPGDPCESGCLIEAACNYDPSATFDCSGVFGGSDTSCCQQLDECGVCGGGGIPAGECDCDGNVIDQCGVCGGDGKSCTGCTDPAASNYDPTATIDDGTCNYATEVGNYCACGDSLALNWNQFVNSLPPADPDALLSTNAQDQDRCLFWNPNTETISTPAGAVFLQPGQYQTLTEAEEAVCDETGFLYGTPCPDGTNGRCWQFDHQENIQPGGPYWDGGCPADLNGDLTVSTADLLEFLTAFGTVCTESSVSDYWIDQVGTNPDCPADINGDGTVATTDLLAFLANFGFECETGLRNSDGIKRCENICDTYDLIVSEAGLVISVAQLAQILGCDVVTAQRRCGEGGPPVDPDGPDQDEDDVTPWTNVDTTTRKGRGPRRTPLSPSQPRPGANRRARSTTSTTTSTGSMGSTGSSGSSGGY